MPAGGTRKSAGRRFPDRSRPPFFLPVCWPLSWSSGITDAGRYLFRPRGRQEIELAEEALAFFQTRDFDRAADRFEGLFIRTRIPAYQLLQQTACHYRQHPPASDWDGAVDQR